MRAPIIPLMIASAAFYRLFSQFTLLSWTWYHLNGYLGSQKFECNSQGFKEPIQLTVFTSPPRFLVAGVANARVKLLPANARLLVEEIPMA